MIKNGILAISLVFISSNVFAASDEVLAQICLQKGIEKVAAQAEAWNCEFKVEKIEVQDIDNRWYSPSKYIWYQVITPCNGYDRVVKMVQYYKGQCI